MKERHTALLVEDEPEMAAELGSLLESIGHAHAHASSREEAEQLLTTGKYCYVLLDLQIKATPDSIKAYVEAGQSLLDSIRELHPERNAKGKHRLQVLVVSGHAKEHDQVVKALQDGADDFLLKPLSQNQRPFRDKVQQALRWSERLTHAHCSTISLQSAEKASSGPPALLAITGVPRGKRIEITLAGKKVALTTASLRVLLTLVHGRLRDADGWVHKTDLGAKSEQGWKGISRLRSELPSMPVIGALIENDATGSYRLSPSVTPAGIEPQAAGLACDARVRDLARKIDALLRGAPDPQLVRSRPA